MSELTADTILKAKELLANDMASFVNMPQDVVDFHKKYGIQYDGPIRMLPSQVKYFRHERNQEECREFYHAQFKHEALDAVIDQIYIILGTAHLMGFTPEIIHEAWKRVHDANMRKVRSSPENPGKYGSAEAGFVDIVKPKGWIAPDLTDLVEVKDA